MQKTHKVCHFTGTISKRYLELYNTNKKPTKISKTESFIRFWIRLLDLRSTGLICGRGNGTKIKFKITESTLVQEGIWHVKGTLQDNRKVLLSVNTFERTSDVIEKLGEYCIRMLL